MIDDVFDVFGKGFLRLLLFIVYELLFQIVLYFIGWPFVKLMTLGKYPKGLKEESYEFTSFIGLLIVICVALFFFL